MPEWYDKAEVNASGWLIASVLLPNATDIEHPYSLSDFCFVWMLTNGTSSKVEENFLVCYPKETSTAEEVMGSGWGQGGVNDMLCFRISPMSSTQPA
jgi:hypothetical protein